MYLCVYVIKQNMIRTIGDILKNNEYVGEDFENFWKEWYIGKFFSLAGANLVFSLDNAWAA